MSTVLITFVPATYTLGTFVHISNVSAIRFLTNFWDPIFGGLSFSGQFFLTKVRLTRALNFYNLFLSFFTQIIFGLENVFVPKFLDQRFFTYFSLATFFVPKIFCNCFFYPKFFGVKFFCQILWT